MSSVVLKDRACLNVHLTMEAAEREAKAIVARETRIVKLYQQNGIGTAEHIAEPIGYVVIPSDHNCSFCGNHVDHLGR